MSFPACTSRRLGRAALLTAAALLTGCGGRRPPTPPTSGDGGASIGAASAAGKPDAVEPAGEPVGLHPLYLERGRIAAVAARAASDPGLRRQIAVLIRPAEAWDRAPTPPRGVYRTYPVPGRTGAFDPAAGGSPAFRTLIDDARAARDLALVWALRLDPPAAGPGAPARTVDEAGRRAVLILRRYAGTGGLSPVVAGREAIVELAQAAATFYHAADLVWEHPAWFGEGADGTPRLDFRGTFCQWANQWARSVQVLLGTLSGLEAAWAHHLNVASIAVAARSPQVKDNHAARFRRAVDGSDHFGLPALLARETTTTGQLPREQWRIDGPSRAACALAAYALTVRAARTQAAWVLPRGGAWRPDGLPAAEVRLASTLLFQAALLMPTPAPPAPPAGDDAVESRPAPSPPSPQLVWYRAVGDLFPEAAAAAKVAPEPVRLLLGPLQSDGR
jgi:hypothetical protein